MGPREDWYIDISNLTKDYRELLTLFPVSAVCILSCLFPIRALSSPLPTPSESPFLCDRGPNFHGRGRSVVVWKWRETANGKDVLSVLFRGRCRPPFGQNKYRPCLLARSLSSANEHPREIFSAKYPSASHFLVPGFANLTRPSGSRSRSVEAPSPVVVSLPQLIIVT